MYRIVTLVLVLTFAACAMPEAATGADGGNLKNQIIGKWVSSAQVGETTLESTLTFANDGKLSWTTKSTINQMVVTSNFECRYKVLSDKEIELTYLTFNGMAVSPKPQKCGVSIKGEEVIFTVVGSTATTYKKVK